MLGMNWVARDSQVSSRTPFNGQEFYCMGGSEPAKAVVKTLQLLEVLSGETALGVTELAERLSMHKSTVYRFMTTLCERGYASQDSDGRYTLTLRLFELGSRIIQSTAIWRHARDVMEWLSQQTQETIHLATIENLRLVYVHKVESTQSLRVSMMSRVGQSAPFHCTGLGKIMLAYADQMIRDAIIKLNPLTRFTDRTITTEHELSQELEQIRSKGVAIDNEEHEIGVRCVAVPIFQYNGNNSLAALSISAPAVRLPNAKLSRYEELLRRASATISERLGIVK
jgi:IclR family KDG regulon transcriptional repressor